MATIAENLQILKDSTDAIKQAIIDNGGTVTGGLSSYAETINNLFIITFTINDVEHQAKVGMTWEEWINSSYNIDGYIIFNDIILASNRSYTVNASPSAVIINNYSYTVSHYGGSND